MKIKRTGYQIKYQPYVLPESFRQNIAFVAINDHDEVMTSASFSFINMTTASLLEKRELKNNISQNEFIEEFLYWNPFVEKVYVKDKVIKNNHPCQIEKVPIQEIFIQQLSINENKLDNISKWIKKEEDVVINCVYMDNKPYCIDGNTRLMSAYLKGFQFVYCFIEDDNDPAFYEAFKNWCETENIYHINDLVNRVVSESEHEKIWVNRCQNYIKNKEK